METKTLPPRPKCGSNAVSSKYEPLFAQQDGASGKFKTTPECLHRTCHSCGYKWESPTLDQMAQMTTFNIGGPLEGYFPEGERPEITPKQRICSDSVTMPTAYYDAIKQENDRLNLLVEELREKLDVVEGYHESDPSKG